MKDFIYKPEGSLIETQENQRFTESVEGLKAAMNKGCILEGRALLCDEEHNLIVSLYGGKKGIIPKSEAAIGISEGKTKDIAIISRVGKPVCFHVRSLENTGKDGEVIAFLSRRSAQRECEDYLFSNSKPGDVLPGRVTRLETFGAFVDIGCGVVSLINIDNISISRISHPRDRFYNGQNIRVIIQNIDRQNRRITLTHKELLGTWSQNAVRFSAGQTVMGIVRTIEDYGIFIELLPNLVGLAEPKKGVYRGQRAAVYIKSISPEKMKIKLAVVDVFDEEVYPPFKAEYFTDTEHMDRFIYSPENSVKYIETVFDVDDNR